MLNLLKYNRIASYEKATASKSTKPISGREAYQIYSKNILEELNKMGGRILYKGECQSFLIGPEFEKWDAILLVEYPSVESFMTFSKSKAYNNNVHHRTAALADSRLLPSTTLK